MKTVDELMVLADAVVESACELVHDCATKQHEHAYGEARAALLTALQESQDTLTFYKRRVELLQEWQSKMRDPERTIACDIIANGQILPDPHGTRYGPAQPNDEALLRQALEYLEGTVQVSWSKPLVESIRARLEGVV